MNSRTGLSHLVKAAAAAADTLRSPPAGVVILLYHRVGGGSATSVDIPRAVFADQIAYLAERTQALSLDEAVDYLEAGQAPPGPPAVAVSFDDGTADFVDHALEVLVAHRVPAVLYVATDHLERRLAFPHGGTPISWAALADAVSTGLVTVGSHTHTHLLLDRVDPVIAAAELDRSIELVADRLGVACRHFAYPKAVPASPLVEPEVRKRFRSAALSGSRPNPWDATSLHRLARTPIQSSDGMRWFPRKLAGGLGLESELRTLLNRRRYRTAER